MADERADFIKELASAATVQTNVANRSWTALITVAVIAVLPRPQGTDIALPLGLGTVSALSFHFVMFALLTVLSIAFAAAHAQQVRAQRLAMKALVALGDEPISAGKTHPRDYFDMLRAPSVTRVAPLAQLFQGMDAFHGSDRRPPPWRKRVSVGYYLALKTVSWLVYFGFPAVALWISFSRMLPTTWQWWPFFFAGVVATLPILQVLLVDVGYVWEVSHIIGRGPGGKPLGRGPEATARHGKSRRS
jgi:hypothetical protein